MLANGATGNIYSAMPADKPNTSILHIPTPWTSSGVGTAIPGSQLGILATTIAMTTATANESTTETQPTTAETTHMSTLAISTAVATTTTSATSSHADTISPLTSNPTKVQTAVHSTKTAMGTKTRKWSVWRLVYIVYLTLLTWMCV